MISRHIVFSVFFLSLFSLQAYKIEQLCDDCESSSIQFIEFCCTDRDGNFKSVIRPAKYLRHDLQHGIYLDGSSIPGCTDITNSDIQLKPDLYAPMEKLAWHNDQTGAMVRIICDMYLDNETPYQSDPRMVLKKQLEEAYSMGYDFYVGPELEFYVFDTTKDQTLMPIDWLSYAQRCDNFAISQAIVSALQILNSMNLNIEKIHHEVGPGQFEMSMHYDNALNIADCLGTAKQAIAVVAQLYGKEVSFMPKPMHGEAGSGMHLNLSLFDIQNQKNAFVNEQNPEQLSDVACHFIAGILKHAREITLLLNPTINSYKRLVKGFEAPIFICCGKKNRSAMIRIPHAGATQPSACRIEMRSPDAMCNPYLAFAALVCAGLEGIKNKYELPTLVDQNVYKMNEGTRSSLNIEMLPASFSEALEAFEQSNLMQKMLGKDLFASIVKSKRDELYAFNTAVTDWELERYY